MKQAAPSLSSTPSLTPDFLVEHHGSIIRLRHRTPAARRWVSKHLPADRQTWGDATIVEPRYIADIIAAARAAGLEVA